MKILKISSIVFMFFLVAVFAINIPDEELSENVQRSLSTASVPPPARQEVENAYFALLGFEAPERADIVEAGQRAYRLYSRARQEGRAGPKRTLVDIIGPPPPYTPPGNIPKCTGREQSPCLPQFEQHSARITALYRLNVLFLERYQSLARFAFFQDLDSMRARSWSPWASRDSALYMVYLLRTAEAARLFNMGDRDAGAEMILSDIVLWRMLLPGFRDIEGKISAQRNLSHSYLLLAEMVEHSPEISLKLRNHAVLSPLSKQERSLDRVWETYFQTMDWQLNRYLSFSERRLFKVNSTLNDSYEIFEDFKRISVTRSAALSSECAELNRKIDRFRQVRVSLLYNPLGKRFIAAALDAGHACESNSGMRWLDGTIAALRKQVTH